MTEISFPHQGEKGRLDQILLSRLKDHPEFSNVTRSQIKNWIEGGAVTVNGKVITKSGSLLMDGDHVTVEPPAAEDSGLAPFNFALELLHEDHDLVVINKPPALTMHPGAGNKAETLVNALVAHLGPEFATISTDKRPGVVHRLDKDTSGIVVVAKTREAHLGLAKQFAARQVERAYQGLALSSPKSRNLLDLSDAGKIEGALGRDPSNRLRMAVRESGGKHAVTHWSAVERFPYGISILLKLETGRTHQIRAHLAAHNSPLVGDRLYGQDLKLPKLLLEAAKKFNRQALHAFKLGFVHPTTHKSMLFEVEMPQDMRELFTIFRSFRQT